MKDSPAIFVEPLWGQTLLEKLTNGRLFPSKGTIALWHWGQDPESEAKPSPNTKCSPLRCYCWISLIHDLVYTG